MKTLIIILLTVVFIGALLTITKAGEKEGLSNYGYKDGE